jgi:hypothetical protein
VTGLLDYLISRCSESNLLPSWQSSHILLVLPSQPL